VAQHVDQPIDIPTLHLSFGSCTNNTSFRDSSLGNIHAFKNIVNAPEDLD
jgi:hypothetical protein